MIKASEARKAFNNSELIKWLDNQGDVHVKKALSKGMNETDFSLYDAPTDLTRSATAEIAMEFYENLGYATRVSSNNTTMHLKW